MPKQNSIGNWVLVDDQDRFFNPRNGQMENFFTPSKHLFHLWRKVCFRHASRPELHVEKVELNPTFSPVLPLKITP